MNDETEPLSVDDLQPEHAIRARLFTNQVLAEIAPQLQSRGIGLTITFEPDLQTYMDELTKRHRSSVHDEAAQEADIASATATQVLFTVYGHLETKSPLEIDEAATFLLVLATKETEAHISGDSGIMPFQDIKPGRSPIDSIARTLCVSFVEINSDALDEY